MLFRGQNILGYKHYADDVVDEFVKKSIETGIDIDRLLDTARFVREALGHSDSATLRAGKISDLSAEGPHHQCNR